MEDLHQRTREGIETARLNGKIPGRRPEAKVVTKKSIEAKATILKHSIDFNGTLSDADVLRIVELELGLLSRRVSELGYSLDASDEAKRLLVKLGYEPAYGVRSLRRTILDRVEEPLSELIVAGAVHAGDRVTVCTDGDRIELSVAPADSPTHLAS